MVVFKTIELKVVKSYKELFELKSQDIVFINGRVEIVINPKEDYKKWQTLSLSYPYKADSIYTVSKWGNLYRENEYDREFCKIETDLMSPSYCKEANVNSKKPLVEAIKEILKQRGLE